MIFGLSGVGKSILLNLIVGFLMLVSGLLIIDGVDYIMMLLLCCLVLMLF